MIDNSNAPPPKASPAKIALAVVLMAMAVGLFVFLRPKPIPVSAQSSAFWFYDLEAGRLVRAADGLAPVVVNERTLVKAYVFTCGECDDPASRFIGYLERISPAGKEVLRTRFQVETYSGPAGIDRLGYDALKDLLPPDAIQLRALNRETWVDAYSPSGLALRKAAESRCGEEATLSSCDQVEFTP